MSWPDNMWVSVTTLWGSGKSWVNLHRTGVPLGMSLQVWKLKMVRMVGYTQKSWAHCHYKYAPELKLVSSPWKVIIPKGGCRFTTTTFLEGWFCWLLGVYIMMTYDDQYIPLRIHGNGRYIYLHLPLKNQPHLGKYFSSDGFNGAWSTWMSQEVS